MESTVFPETSTLTHFLELHPSTRTHGSVRTKKWSQKHSPFHYTAAFVFSLIIRTFCLLSWWSVRHVHRWSSPFP